MFKKSKTKSQSVQDLRTLREIEENLESFTGFDPEDGPISAESFHPERSHLKENDETQNIGRFKNGRIMQFSIAFEAIQQI